MSIQIFDIKQTAQDLERMVTDVMTKQGMFIPISKDVIRYKKYIIKRHNDGQWTVLHTEPIKKHIATTFLKVSALAICKLNEKRLSMKVDEVLKADHYFAKHYIDSVHYKHTMKITKDIEKQDIAQWRYELAHARAKQAKELVDRVFYSLLT
jgi:hypothetical protein